MRALLFAGLLVALVSGCAPARTPADSARAADATSAATAPASTTSNDATPPVSSTGIPGRTKPAPPMSRPLPPQVEEAPPRGAPKLDTSCRTDADCTVKNVGNCCGAMPACVNTKSPADPAAVQAECARKGVMSACGFKNIQSCSCVAGTCRDAGGDSTPVAQ